MKYLVSELYSEFECIGAACPDTCCRSWDIYIDKDHYEGYCNIKDDTIREEILRNIIFEDGLYRFKLREDGFCPFLTEKGLCSIYLKVSPDSLCKTCQTYPRLIKNYYDVIFATLSLSCPEVVRLLFQFDKPLEFELVENEVSVDTSQADWLLYNELINGFVISVDILQDRSLPLWRRLELLLDLSEIIQQGIDNNELEQIRKRTNCFRNKGWRRNSKNENLFLTNMGKFINDLFGLLQIFSNQLVIVKLPENNEEINRWTREFAEKNRDDIEYEKIAVCLAFEYYMDALSGKSLDVSACKILLYLTMIYSQEMFCAHLGEELNQSKRIELISKLSRSIEHSTTLETIVDGFLKKNERKNIYALLSLFKD